MAMTRQKAQAAFFCASLSDSSSVLIRVSLHSIASLYSILINDSTIYRDCAREREGGVSAALHLIKSLKESIAAGSRIAHSLSLLMRSNLFRLNEALPATRSDGTE
jgi:hypothetical protein